MKNKYIYIYIYIYLYRIPQQSQVLTGIGRCLKPQYTTKDLNKDQGYNK